MVPNASPSYRYFQPAATTVSPSNAVHTSRMHGKAGKTSLSLIVDGGPGFNRKFIEELITIPGFSISIIDGSELVGTNRVERGLALLAEIRRRKESGEISSFIPVGVFLHGYEHNGELMLSDAQASFSLPASVLFHALSTDTDSASAPAANAGPIAPVLLSSCEAEKFAPSLTKFPRPVLISGGIHNVYAPDANAVMIRFIEQAQLARMEGKVLDTDRLFDAVSHTSGEPLHRIEAGHWETHEVLSSVTSLDDIPPLQESLYMCSVLRDGTVDQLAEAVLLFGVDPLRRHFPYKPDKPDESSPVLWHLALRSTRDFLPKLVLLVALGEDIDQRNKKGSTLLHEACKWRFEPDGDDPGDEICGDVDMARVLLANGANLYARNSLGLVPTDLAGISGNDDLVGLLFSDTTTHQNQELTPAGMLGLARRSGWGCVASLLEELGVAALAAPAQEPQAMEVSDS